MALFTAASTCAGSAGDARNTDRRTIHHEQRDVISGCKEESELRGGGLRQRARQIGDRAVQVQQNGKVDRVLALLSHQVGPKPGRPVPEFDLNAAGRQRPRKLTAAVANPKRYLDT